MELFVSIKKIPRDNLYKAKLKILAVSMEKIII